MPFSRPRVLTASTISADMSSVSHEVRTVDVGVGDRHDARRRGHGDRVVGGVEELAGERLVAVLGVAGADPGLAPDIAAEVLRLGERTLSTRARHLEGVVLANLG